MDNRAQVREFLASRRARITPGQAGLPAYGGNPRERGDLAGASESVLDGVADALQLDEAEREHLRALARSARPRRAAPDPA